MKKGIFFANIFNSKYINHDYDKSLKFISERDFKNLHIDYNEIPFEDAEKFSALCKKYGVNIYSMHCLCRICSDDDEIFNSAIENMDKVFEKAKILACKNVLIVPFVTSDVKGIEDRTRALLRLTKGLNLINKKAEKYNINIYIENISQRILPFSLISDIAYLMENVKGLHYNFDCGNFVCTQENPLDALKKLSKYISSVHIKDFEICNNGEYKCDSGIFVNNISFGKGNANLCQVVTKIYKMYPDIPYIIEIHSVSPEYEELLQTFQFTESIERKNND